MSLIANLETPTGLIAVMGPTGSGKSSFVNAILGEVVAPVNGGMESVTADVAQYTHVHRGRMVVRVVDTPGFNDYRGDGSKSDLKILQMIGAFLKKEYDANQKFSGVIFLHSINHAKVDWQTQRRNMTLFKKLCGTDSMKNVVVVTSFWDQLSNFADGVQREKELQTEAGLLKELHDGGAKFVRSGHFDKGKFPQDPEFFTPQQVLDHLLTLDPVYLRMQMEMAEGASVAETSAGSTLLEEFGRLKRETQASLEAMKLELESVKSADEENRSHREELKRETERVQERLKNWEKHGSEMQMQLAQWEEYRKQTATKEELDALVSRNKKDLGGLHTEVNKLRETNEKLRQIDQQRIDELNEALTRVRKDRDSLSEECKALRSGQHLGIRDQFQGFTTTLADVARGNEWMREEIKRLQASLATQGEEFRTMKDAYSEAQKELEKTKESHHQAQLDLKVANEARARSQVEVKDLNISYDNLGKQYNDLDAKYNKLLQTSGRLQLEVETLSKQLQEADAQRAVLKSRNKNIEQELKEATLAAEATISAAEDFKAQVMDQLQSAKASMEGEVKHLRSQNAQYEIDLQKRDQELSNLKAQIEELYSQMPMATQVPDSATYSTYPPLAEETDPYEAWNNLTGGPFALQMPSPSFPTPSSQSTALPFQSLPSFAAPPSLPPRPQSAASQTQTVPFPSSDLRIEVNLGNRTQGTLPASQQGTHRPPPAHPSARNVRPSIVSPGPPGPRSQTPQTHRPMPWGAQGNQSRWNNPLSNPEWN